MLYTHLHGKATDDSERKPARNRADIGRRFPCGYNNKKTCSHSIQIYAVDDEIDKNNFANEKKRFCKNHFCISFLKRNSIFFRWGKKKIKFYQTSPFSQFILTLHLISKLLYFSLYTHLLPSHGHASFSILTSLHNSGTFLSRRGPEKESVWVTL